MAHTQPVYHMKHKITYKFSLTHTLHKL